MSFGSSPRMSEPDKKRRLASIGDLLRKSGLTSWVNRIFGARVPIISFVTTVDLGEISFDISIRNDEDTGPHSMTSGIRGIVTNREITRRSSIRHGKRPGKIVSC